MHTRKLLDNGRRKRNQLLNKNKQEEIVIAVVMPTISIDKLRRPQG